MENENQKPIPRPVWTAPRLLRKTAEPAKPDFAPKKEKGSFSKKIPAIFKVQFDPSTFERMAAIAERMLDSKGRPIRKPGIALWKPGKKMRADKLVPNTKSIPKAMKAAMLYWEGDEANRAMKQAEARRKLDVAKAEAEAVGLKSG